MSYFTPYKEHYKALIRLGIPTLTGQIGIVVVGLADNMMVGQYAISTWLQLPLSTVPSISPFFSVWVFLMVLLPGRTIFRPS
ncbi:MAG: hypothetical protein ACLUOS_17195 [Odoribacter splanchnicus]